MSEENVELVLKGVEDWNRGDMDAWFGLFDDDAVLRPAEGWPERDFRGKDAVRSFYEGFAETVGRDTVIEDLIDAGDVVITRCRAHVTGVKSAPGTIREFEKFLREAGGYSSEDAKLVASKGFNALTTHREGGELALAGEALEGALAAIKKITKVST